MADKDPSSEATSRSGCVIKPSAKQKAQELGAITDKAGSSNSIINTRKKKGKRNLPVTIPTSDNPVSSTGDHTPSSTAAPTEILAVEIDTTESSEDDEAKLGQ